LAYAERHAAWESPRSGKRVGLFEIQDKRIWKSDRIHRATGYARDERHIDKHGQVLLVPEVELAGW
jgi:hypothetical protein